MITLSISDLYVYVCVCESERVDAQQLCSKTNPRKKKQFLTHLKTVQIR